MKNSAIVVSSGVFLLVAIMHLLRIIFKVSVTVGGVELPLRYSVIGVTLPLVLAVWLFSSLKKQ